VSGENYIMRSLVICTAHQILFGCETKGNDMGQPCITYGGEARCIEGFGRKKTYGTDSTWKT
jgi:hypothetical protein